METQIQKTDCATWFYKRVLNILIFCYPGNKILVPFTRNKGWLYWIIWSSAFWRQTELGSNSGSRIDLNKPFNLYFSHVWNEGNHSYLSGLQIRFKCDIIFTTVCWRHFMIAALKFLGIIPTSVSPAVGVYWLITFPHWSWVFSRSWYGKLWIVSWAFWVFGDLKSH